MTSSITRPRVLVVDDDDLMRRGLVRLLDALGVEVLATSSGRGALALLDWLEPLPDLIITDVRMPDVSGEDLLRHVRGDEALAAIPVVAMTGAGTRGPFDLVLTKPFSQEALREALCLAWPAEDLDAAERARLFRTLDGRPGPAPRLSPADSTRFVRAVVEVVAMA